MVLLNFMTFNIKISVNMITNTRRLINLITRVNCINLNNRLIFLRRRVEVLVELVFNPGRSSKGNKNRRVGRKIGDIGKEVVVGIVDLRRNRR